MTTLKDGLKEASKDMENPCFVANNGVWGFSLDLIASQGCAVRVYDCPAEYRPDCEDDWPAEQWLAAIVDKDGHVRPLYGLNTVKETQKFLWDAFTDADAVGVSLNDLLTWPGLHLAQGQISSVEAHYYKPEEWSKEDEQARNIIADATDSEDFNRLYSWLIWAVGDQTAANLVEDWEQCF